MYMYVYKYFIKSKYSKLLNIQLTNLYVAVFVFKYGIHYQATWDNPPIPAKVNRTSLFSTGDSVSYFCKILFVDLFLQIENINDVKYGNDIYLQFSRFHGLLVFPHVVGKSSLELKETYGSKLSHKHNLSKGSQKNEYQKSIWMYSVIYITLYSKLKPTHCYM